MKKLFLLLLAIVSTIAFTSCTDFHQGERPTDLGAAIWVSDDPNVWFETLDSEEYSMRGKDYIFPKGQLTIDGETKDIRVGFDHGRSISIYINNSKRYIDFGGTCRFSPEKLIVKVDKERDWIFGNKYKTITFVRKAVDVGTFDISDFAEYISEHAYEGNVGEIADAVDAIEKAKSLWQELNGVEYTEEVKAYYDKSSGSWYVRGTKPYVFRMIFKEDGAVLAVGGYKPQRF